MAEAAGLQNIAVVEDPEVRRKLTPDMPFGCKRPLASNVYYPTFNLPHVELVTEPIAEITDDAVVTADGRARQVDTIILATGFATTKFLGALDVVGRDGVHIDDAWADGAQAYLGITTAGFPNLFMLYGPNTNNGSIIYMIECQVDYVMRVLQRMDDEGIACARREARRDGRVQRGVAGDARRRRGLAGRVPRLLPRAVRPHRHAVAGVDVASTAPARSDPDLDAFEVVAARPINGRFRCAVPPSGHDSAIS